MIYFSNGVINSKDLTLTPTNGILQVLKISNGQILDANSMLVYPNPFENQLSLTVSESTTYSILDLNGKILKSGSVNANGSIDLSELNSGSYLLNTINNSGSSVISVVKR